MLSYLVKNNDIWFYRSILAFMMHIVYRDRASKYRHIILSPAQRARLLRILEIPVSIV